MEHTTDRLTEFNKSYIQSNISRGEMSENMSVYSQKDRSMSKEMVLRQLKEFKQKPKQVHKANSVGNTDSKQHLEIEASEDDYQEELE